MGSEAFEENEKPAHKVKITKAFRLGQHEVTQAQYTAVVGSNPSHYKGSSNPVEMVSWTDAVAFCKLLSDLPEEKAAGRAYRLPTEAEWEYACRAGTTKDYFFGEDSSALGYYGWVRINSGGRSHPCGLKKPNPWGCYDMYGNVYEYVHDWLGDYPNAAVTDPAGPASGSKRGYRGGRWDNDAKFCLSACRGTGANPRGSSFSGFRVVCVQSDK